MESALMLFCCLFLFSVTEIGKCATTLLSIDLLSRFGPICLMVTRVPLNANSAGHLGLCHAFLALGQAARDGCLRMAVSDVRLGAIIASEAADKTTVLTAFRSAASEHLVNLLSRPRLKKAHVVITEVL